MPRFIDLTLPLAPGVRGVAVEPAFTLEHDGWNAATWHLYSHAGTHMDAAAHFGVGSRTIDQQDIAHCLGTAWVARITPCAPRAILTVADLGSIAVRFRRGENLLLHTNWSRYAGDPAAYRDQLPRVGVELAEWCVAQGVNMLGVEPPSVADVNDIEEVTQIHRILLEGGVTIVEGLAGLDQLRQERVFFAALPLRLAGGDGSPVRAFAMEDEAGVSETEPGDSRSSIPQPERKGNP